MYALSQHKPKPYLIGKRKKMAKFTKLSFCQKLFQQNVVQVDFPAYALSMHKQNAVRITKGNNSNRIGP